MVLSFPWLRWLTTSSSVVTCMIGPLLKLSHFCIDLSNFLSFNLGFRFSFHGFKYYKPVIWDVWSSCCISWKGPSSVRVIMTSRVWPLLCVGIFTCLVRLNATNESSNIVHLDLPCCLYTFWYLLIWLHSSILRTIVWEGHWIGLGMLNDCHLLGS